MEERAKRKLSAILSADVKGYSRLMGEDELGTVRTLEAYREMIAEVIRSYGGRVVDSPGDNLLAEFASVVDAVESAVEIQKELRAKNEDFPEKRRMEFRIGINLGDVIEEGERIYGDGVNIAARLESLAEGGGICISGTAFDQVETKLRIDFEYLGEQVVKNIKKPVRVYRVKMESRVLDDDLGQELSLPDEPSIAILPFDNMSGDPKQEYFSDGITEEIITALSKTPKLLVIARNSTFTYKGKPVKVQEVGKELGVRYVLEGSVRKVGKMVRITAQLVDAKTGNHLWAERYDRKLKDIFAIQDEVTMEVMTALQVKLTEGEQARLLAKDTENLEAYLKFWQGVEHVRRGDKDGNRLAKPLLEEVITLEPEWAAGYVGLGFMHLMDVWYRWSDSPLQSIQEGFRLAQEALALDESNSGAHALLGQFYTLTRQHEKAIEEGERAITLNPNSSQDIFLLAVSLVYAGRPKEASSSLERAMRLNPFPPPMYLLFLGHANRMLGRYEEAMSAYKKAIHIEPTLLFGHVGLAATYVLLDRKEEAFAEAAEVLRIDPKFSLEYFAGIVPYKNKADTELYVDALRKAGLK
jgi:adenylate cyclase